MSDKFDDIKTKVEAILFSYADWITLNEIKETLEIDSEKLVQNSLTELKEKYKSGFPFDVQEDERGRWRMALKPEHEDLVSALIAGTEIPKNVLKVLSVIAYEQPVTKTRLSEIIGRYVKPEVDYLYKAKFVNYEKVGIGKYYRVTKKFFDYFKIDNEEEFKEQVNKSMKTFLEEPSDEELESVGTKYEDNSPSKNQ